MFETLHQFTAVAATMAEEKADYVLPINALRFTGEGSKIAAMDLFNRINGEATKHAFWQLFGRLGVQHGARFSWEDGLRYPREFALLANRLLDDDKYTHNNGNGVKQLLCRTYRGDFRAFLSDQYRPYDNLDYLKAAEDFLGNAPHSIVSVYNHRRSHIDPDSMYVKVVQADWPGHDGEYKFGWALRNDEIGKSSIRINPLIWRGRCQNAIVIARSIEQEAKELGIAMRIPHRWHSVKQLNYMVKMALGFSLGKGPEFIDEMAAAATKELPDAADILAKMIEARNFSQEATDSVTRAGILGMEGEATVAGLVNGLSFAAHKAQDKLTDDQQAELEYLSGSVLAASRGKDRIADLTAEFFSLVNSPVLAEAETE